MGVMCSRKSRAVPGVPSNLGRRVSQGFWATLLACVVTANVQAQSPVSCEELRAMLLDWRADIHNTLNDGIKGRKGYEWVSRCVADFTWKSDEIVALTLSNNMDRVDQINQLAHWSPSLFTVDQVTALIRTAKGSYGNAAYVILRDVFYKYLHEHSEDRSLDPVRPMLLDKDLVLHLLRWHQIEAEMLMWLPDDWLSPDEVVALFRETDRHIPWYMLPKKMQCNRAIAMGILALSRENNPDEAGAIVRAFNDDRDLVSRAVARRGTVLKYASPRLRGDIAVVRIAVKQDSCSLMWATPTVQVAREFRGVDVLRCKKEYERREYEANSCGD